MHKQQPAVHIYNVILILDHTRRSVAQSASDWPTVDQLAGWLIYTSQHVHKVQRLIMC